MAGRATAALAVALLVGVPVVMSRSPAPGGPPDGVQVAADPTGAIDRGDRPDTERPVLVPRRASAIEKLFADGGSIPRLRTDGVHRGGPSQLTERPGAITRVFTEAGAPSIARVTGEKLIEQAAAGGHTLGIARVAGESTLIAYANAEGAGT